MNANGELKAKLVYSLIPKHMNREGFLLDAQTGQWRSVSSGEVISLDKVVVSDIEGHWGQQALQLMLDYQALDVKDGKVNPDDKIKRGELVKMLVIAMNGGNGGFYYGADRAASFADVSNGSKYFAYVENAVDRGLLDVGAEFNPEATMNREEMAQLIVKALGYKTLAKYDGIFNESFRGCWEIGARGRCRYCGGAEYHVTYRWLLCSTGRSDEGSGSKRVLSLLEKRSELQEQPRYYY